MVPHWLTFDRIHNMNIWIYSLLRVYIILGRVAWILIDRNFWNKSLWSLFSLRVRVGLCVDVIDRCRWNATAECCSMRHRSSFNFQRCVVPNQWPRITWIINSFEMDTYTRRWVAFVHRLPTKETIYPFNDIENGTSWTSINTLWWSEKQKRKRERELERTYLI